MESYDVLIVPDSLWSFIMNLFIPISSFSNINGVKFVGVDGVKGKDVHDVDGATGKPDSCLGSRPPWVTPCTCK